MLHFSRWKTVSILTVILLGLIFAIPSLFSQQTVDTWPDALPKSRINLGLDLQGGVHLQVKIDEEGLIEERLETLNGDIRAAMLSGEGGRIGYRGITGQGREVRVRLLKAEDATAAKERLAVLLEPVNAAGSLLAGLGVVEVELSEETDTQLVYSLTDEGIENRIRSAVSQSIEVIRRRIDELGTTEPIIQRQGTDRIIVQVPGFDDPERLKEIIGETAKLTFREVNENANPLDAMRQGGRAPAGYELFMTNDDEPRPVLVEKRIRISGEDLADAQAGFDGQTNEPIVSFRFNLKASRIFCEYTQNNIGNRFAVVLDTTVISDPVIRSAICGGSGQISGNFTTEAANDLAVLMRAGALPAKITFVEERTVGPGLGQDSIDAGQSASIVAGILVIVFMVAAYGLLGGIATIALTANVILIIAALSVLGATLTLPGIAGIVLTIGMAVDANVLIFERVREERRAGRSIVQAVDIGFRQALSTILDANITTLIAAFILFYLGSGPIRGFAVTLAIGIITSVFTAFTMTRLLMSVWLRTQKPKELPNGLFRLVPEGMKAKFMWLRKVSFPTSAALLIGSLAMFVIANLNYGIDFRGGTLIEYQSKSEVADLGDVRERLSQLNLGDVQVQEFGSPNELLIRIESQGAGDNAEQSALLKVRDAMDSDHTFRRQEVVGPTVSGELAQAGTIAVLVSLLAIMVYIWFRFEWQFALGAVLATMHDVILTIGMFAVLQLEFSLSSIAAILTIVGYSLNDTVVVYDRIRENLRKYKKMPIRDLLDMSINDTLSRTVMTSVTTLLALLALYFLGGEVLSAFTFAMIFGVVIGTYSSVFIAAPLLILFQLRPGAMDKVDVSPYAGKEQQEVS
ncbi:protein translocase subunit SecD [Pseudahrensia aquimaris]|uniref:Multifunctional fusion protein n=1 Tax=Pseudahrensia aquimaris TaxID=744461 RepID=A0ABW3FJD3_9HYPH